MLSLQSEIVKDYEPCKYKRKCMLFALEILARGDKFTIVSIEVNYNPAKFDQNESVLTFGSRFDSLAVMFLRPLLVKLLWTTTLSDSSYGSLSVYKIVAI